MSLYPKEEYVPIPYGLKTCGIDMVALGLHDLVGCESEHGYSPASHNGTTREQLRAAMDQINWARLRLVQEMFWINFDGSGVVCVSDEEHILLSERRYARLVKLCRREHSPEEFNRAVELAAEGKVPRAISGELDEG